MSILELGDSIPSLTAHLSYVFIFALWWGLTNPLIGCEHVFAHPHGLIMWITRRVPAGL